MDCGWRNSNYKADKCKNYMEVVHAFLNPNLNDLKLRSTLRCIYEAVQGSCLCTCCIRPISPQRTEVFRTVNLVFFQFIHLKNKSWFLTSTLKQIKNSTDPSWVYDPIRFWPARTNTQYLESLKSNGSVYITDWHIWLWQWLHWISWDGAMADEGQNCRLFWICELKDYIKM